MKHDSHDIWRHFPFSFFQFNLQSVELVQHCHTMHFHVMRFSVNPLGGFKCRARALCTLYNRGRITASRENCPVTQSADEMMSIGNFNLPVFYLAFMLVFVKKKKRNTPSLDVNNRWTDVFSVLRHHSHISLKSHSVLLKCWSSCRALCFQCGWQNQINTASWSLLEPMILREEAHF